MGGVGAASRSSAAAVGRGSATPGESRQTRERTLKQRTAGEDGPFRGRPAGGAACERGQLLTGEGSDNDQNDITAGRPTARPAGSDSRERTDPATKTWRRGIQAGSVRSRPGGARPRRGKPDAASRRSRPDTERGFRGNGAAHRPATSQTATTETGCAAFASTDVAPREGQEDLVKFAGTEGERRANCGPWRPPVSPAARDAHDRPKSRGRRADPRLRQALFAGFDSEAKAAARAVPPCQC